MNPIVAATLAVFGFLLLRQKAAAEPAPQGLRRGAVVEWSDSTGRRRGTAIGTSDVRGFHWAVQTEMGHVAVVPAAKLRVIR